MYMSNIIQTKMVVFGNICVYTYTNNHVIPINKKESMNLKDSKERYMIWFRRINGRGEILSIYSHLIKKKTKAINIIQIKEQRQ